MKTSPVKYSLRVAPSIKDVSDGPTRRLRKVPFLTKFWILYGKRFRVRSFTSELNKSFHDRTSLKCIWNEIFDNNFIVLLESVLRDKINAVYRLLITFLYPQLWRSEVLKIKWKNGKKLSKDQ